MKKILFSVLTLVLGLVLSGGSCITPVNPPDPLFDEGVDINGTIWATRNVDSKGTFASRPEDFGLLYQWNHDFGWQVTGSVSGWVNTESTATIWGVANNPCPPGWKVPTKAQLDALVASGGAWGPRSGVSGYTFGVGANIIFLPAVGARDKTGMPSLSGGHYWASEEVTATPSTAHEISFNESSVNTSNTMNKCSGASVRCVK